jgi:hypothetical protein
MIFIAVVMAFSLPYVSIGITAWYFPTVSQLMLMILWRCSAC